MMLGIDPIGVAIPPIFAAKGIDNKILFLIRDSISNNPKTGPQNPNIIAVVDVLFKKKEKKPVTKVIEKINFSMELFDFLII